jgi:hypothetical protein
MRWLSACDDETSHLPSGYTYLITGQLRLNPQHPPLVKLLAALPLYFLHPRLDLDDPAWTSEPPREWRFGMNFLSENDADTLLFWGRLPTVLLALLLGFYVFRWARELFGTAAGLCRERGVGEQGSPGRSRPLDKDAAGHGLAEHRPAYRDARSPCAHVTGRAATPRVIPRPRAAVRGAGCFTFISLQCARRSRHGPEKSQLAASSNSVNKALPDEAWDMRYQPQ